MKASGAHEDSDASAVPIAALPVVDLSDWWSGDPVSKAKIATTVGAACRDKGFFYLIGHGIDQQMIDDAFTHCRDFFDLPMAEKEKVGLDRSALSRGFEPVGTQTLEADTPPDLKEGYYLGRERPGGMSLETATRLGLGENRWPAGLPGFRVTLLEYVEQMTGLAGTLMSVLALSLDLDENYFADFCAAPTPTLRLLHYPQQPARGKPGEKGAGAHTDWGGITLLAQDSNGGLQVKDNELGWVHAAPIRGAFVVNLGDLIARWTNDQYSSTLHRVVNLSGAERYSMPFFYSGHPDHPVHCIPTCISAGDKPKYPPTTPAEHTRAKQLETYGA